MFEHFFKDVFNYLKILVNISGVELLFEPALCIYLETTQKHERKGGRVRGAVFVAAALTACFPPRFLPFLDTLVGRFLPFLQNTKIKNCFPIFRSACKFAKRGGEIGEVIEKITVAILQVLKIYLGRYRSNVGAKVSPCTTI